MRFIQSFFKNNKYKDVRIILYAFLLMRIIDFLIISIAFKVVPYLGFFPYKGTIDSYHLPQVLAVLASFDGAHYLNIAKDGYLTYSQAFFPLYPLAIKLVGFIFGNNYLLTGIIISNVAFLAGLIVWKKYLDTIQIDKKISLLFCLFLILFPTSFFFGAVYTESLFFLFFSLSLYLHNKKYYFWSFLFSMLTSLTRFFGIFLSVFYAIDLLYRYKKGEKIEVFGVVSLFGPVVGFLLYALYLLVTTGDPLFFYHAEPAFGANRSTHLIFLPQVMFRYLKIFVTSDWNFQYFVAILEFVFFIIVFAALIYYFVTLIKTRKNKNFPQLLSLCLFSLINIILPTMTGTLSAIPRYVLFSLSFFLVVAAIKNKLFLIFVSILFFIFHAILLGFFAQGYYIS